MPDDDEIVVSIPTDGMSIDEPGVVVTTGETDPAKVLKSQFDTIKGQLDDEKKARESDRRAREAAEADAAKARQEATQARGDATISQFDVVVSGIETATAEADAAEREFTAAYEAGDGKAQAQAQRKMAQAEARKVRLEEAKADLEARKTAAPRTEQRTEPAGDPVDKYISQFSSRSQTWLRDHRDHVTDATKNSRLIAAHHLAVADGLKPDSDEYFGFLEKNLRLGKDAAVDDTRRQTTTTQRRASAPVAPVNGGGGMNGGSGGSLEVRLTRSEAERSEDGTLVWNYPDPTGKGRWKVGDPIGKNEFARRKIALQKQGAYDKTYSEG